MGGRAAKAAVKAAAMADSLTNGKIAQKFINCHCLAWLGFAVAALNRHTVASEVLPIIINNEIWQQLGSTCILSLA